MNPSEDQTKTIRGIHKRWILPATDSIQSLELDRHATLGSLGDDEVLVELHAASLNYRDLMIVTGGVGGEIKKSVVPGSDGAGIIKAVGKNVTNFATGDRVVTHMCPFLSEDRAPPMADISAGLGQLHDGTIAELRRFHESAIVHAPKNLDFERAATLTCSGLSAWNALFGPRGRAVHAGDWVLVQGTGGVSIAALQFAVAAGANVVATTSNEEKAKRLRDMGAKHALNYRTTPTWGSAARELIPDDRGFDFVVDIGGNDTLPESLNVIRTDGIIAATGLLGGMDVKPVPMLSALFHACTVRGLLLGTQEQFREMVKFVEEKNVQPVMDDVSFGLDQTKDAYQRLHEQKHFSKIRIKIR